MLVAAFYQQQVAITEVVKVFISVGAYLAHELGISFVSGSQFFALSLF